MKSFAPVLALPRTHWLHYQKVDHPECMPELERRETERHRVETEEKVRTARRDAVTAWYARPNLPIDAQVKTFSTFQVTPENQQVVQRLKAWRTGDDFGFLITGPAGTGKSHLAFAILNQMISEWVASPTEESSLYLRDVPLPSYFSVSELLATMRAKEGTSELDRKLLLPNPIFLDDLGTESITDWSRDILFRIFEYRLNHRYPTFITSNLTLNELKDRLHERVTSRIIGLCVPVMLKGKDRRMDVLADKVKLLNSRITA
jgi:DNA replication protein DnaC